MTKYFFRLLLLLAIPIAILWLIGSLLPRSYDFETSITIKESPEVLFPLLNQPQNWPLWSHQWNQEIVPSLEIEFNETEKGVGAAFQWTDVRGKGKLWITESVEPTCVKFESKYSNFPLMKSEFTLSPTEEGTTIHWRSAGELPPGPLYGYFGGVFSVQMKNQYQISLQGLKDTFETSDTE